MSRTPGRAAQNSPALPDEANLDFWTNLEKGVCSIAVFLLGVRIFVFSGLTPGYLVAMGLLPVWLRVLRHFEGATRLFLLASAAWLFGLLLTVVSSMNHRVDIGNLLADSILIVGVFCGIGLLLWARCLFPAGTVGLLFGLGMLLGASLGKGPYTDNPWKTAWAIPLGIIFLSMASEFRRHVVEIVVLLLLAGLSILFDSRSYFGTFLLSAVFLLWQSRPTARSKKSAWGWSVALIGALTVVIYNFGSALLVDGYLGAEAQERSQRQIDTAGSLILGGRPEIAATLALMRDRIVGYGLGVVPTWDDVNIGKSGMVKINYQPNNGYVERYMFGGRFELHSIVGDLWAKLGLVGIILALAMAFVLIRAIARSLSTRTGTGLLYFVACWSAWNLLFSPLYSAVPTLTIALGLALFSESTEERDAMSPPSTHWDTQ